MVFVEYGHNTGQELSLLKSILHLKLSFSNIIFFKKAEHFIICVFSAKLSQSFQSTQRSASHCLTGEKSSYQN